LNIDVASEFILVAATLMRIKAKMLIPRKELDEEGNEIDPREELAQKLLEYKQFKEVLDDFSDMEDIRHLKHYRGNVSSELKEIANKALVDIELESLSLINLLRAYKNVMEKFEADKNKIVHTIQRYPYTIEDQQSYIQNRIPKKGKIDFNNLFLKLENRVHAIVTFLALLELLNAQTIMVIQGEGTNNFWVERVVEE
jgi:segregation and condensation protein A